MRPWIVITIVAVVCGAAALVSRDQRATNRQILDTLNQVKSSFDDQARRARELEQQVAVLTERVTSLEAEITDLRRRVTTLSRRPAVIAPAAPAPLPATALAPMAPLAPEGTEAPYAPHAPYALYAPLVPLAPEGTEAPYAPLALYAPYAPLVVPPSAPIVLQRKLTDPAFVKKLYATYAALQLADVASTTAALRSGNGREANPLVRGYAHSPAAMIGVKAAITVGTILALERVREKRPVAVSLTLIALNATLAAVVINNSSIAAK
jgi:cell division protein FtsB